MHWKSPAITSCSILIALILTACGGDGAAGPEPEPGITVIAGGDVIDTVETQPLQALIVEVRDSRGVLRPGVVVRFEAQRVVHPHGYELPGVFVCALTVPTCPAFGPVFHADTTDEHGRAQASVRLGWAAGRAVVRLTVPELAMVDSVEFTVLPGEAAAVDVAMGDTVLDIGATTTMHGSVTDRFGNQRTEVVTFDVGTGTAVTVNPATGLVNAVAMGAQLVFARFGEVADSIVVRVLPTARLVVWNPAAAEIRLVNIDGTNVRTIITGVGSDFGTFPRFDGTRQRVTVHTSGESARGLPTTIVVSDTSTSAQRQIPPSAGFTLILAVRQLGDGTVLVVGYRTAELIDGALWRVASDNQVTLVANLPGLYQRYGGADISHDGTRVAYIALDQLHVLTVATGQTDVLEPVARSPRFSSQGDRLAYLVPPNIYVNDGIPTVINLDRTGRRAIASSTFSPGLAWSPDGVYVVGRHSESRRIRLIRVSDGTDMWLELSTAYEDYHQPDWR